MDDKDVEVMDGLILVAEEEDEDEDDDDYVEGNPPSDPIDGFTAVQHAFWDCQCEHHYECNRCCAYGHCIDPRTHEADGHWSTVDSRPRFVDHPWVGWTVGLKTQRFRVAEDRRELFAKNIYVRPIALPVHYDDYGVVKRVVKAAVDTHEHVFYIETSGGPVTVGSSYVYTNERNAT